MLCPIKVNSCTIELTVDTYCHCVLDLLCVTRLKYFQMPNYLQGKKTLFPTKYPTVPKKKNSYKKAPKTSKIEMLMKMAENVSGNQDLGPGKRTRRLPQRYVLVVCFLTGAKKSYVLWGMVKMCPVNECFGF